MVNFQQAIKNVSILPVQRELNPDITINDLEGALISSLREDIKEDEVLHVALSGGVDSSLIIALIYKNFNDREIHAYTLAEDENSLDLYYAREVCKQFNIEHNVLLSKDIDDRWRQEFSRLAEQHEILRKPGVTFGNNILFILHKWVSQFTDRIITGDGADEICGGYAAHKWPLGWKGPEPVDSTERELLKEMHTDHMAGMSSDDNRRAAFEFFWRRFVPDQLEVGELFAKHVGLEVRMPYLNSKVINTINQIGVREKTLGDVGKYALKRIAVKYLSHELVYSRKRGIDRALG